MSGLGLLAKSKVSLQSPSSVIFWDKLHVFLAALESGGLLWCIWTFWCVPLSLHQSHSHILPNKSQIRQQGCANLKASKDPEYRIEKHFVFFQHSLSFEKSTLRLHDDESRHLLTTRSDLWSFPQLLHDMTLILLYLVLPLFWVLGCIAICQDLGARKLGIREMHQNRPEATCFQHQQTNCKVTNKRDN